MLAMTDTERLDWIESQGGIALVSDDFGHWCISGDGLQNIPEEVMGDNPTPGDIQTTFFIEKERWCTSVREAIDVAIDIAKADLFEE